MTQWIAAIGMVILAAGALPAAADAQAGAPPPNGVLTAGDQPTDYGPRKPQPPGNPAGFPRLQNGHPDFTGIWYAGVKDLVDLSDGKVDMHLRPDYQEVRAKRAAATEAGTPYPDYVSTCQAFGMPRFMSYGNLEFAARPDELWVIGETLHEVRRIYIDNRTHGQDQEASFDGVSTGKWDHDTLVVTTTNLRAGYLDMAGAPHSDKLKIIEHIHFVNKNQIADDLTVEDPVAVTHPLTFTERYDRRPKDFEVAEYICTENYRSGGGVGLTGAAAPGAMLPPSAQSDEK